MTADAELELAVGLHHTPQHRLDDRVEPIAHPVGELPNTTILPGPMTLDLVGHEIELLPRLLIINKGEHTCRTAGSS